MGLERKCVSLVEAAQFYENSRNFFHRIQLKVIQMEF